MTSNPHPLPLQVNGRDVSDKEETESLFAEDKKAVTLLISRYLSIDDYFENSDDMYSDNELWNDDSDEKRLLMESVNATSATTPPSAVPTKERIGLSPKRTAVQVLKAQTPREKAATPPTNNRGSGMAHAQDFSSLHDPLHHTKVKAHLESVNNEIQLLDLRMEQLMMAKKNEGPDLMYQDPVDSRPAALPRSNSMVERFSTPAPVVASKVARSSNQVVDSETEHIYETIPEYSESEPIYCSPHESQVDLVRVQPKPPVMRWSKSFSAKDKITRNRTQQQRLSGGDDNHCDNSNTGQFSSSPFNTTDSGNSNKFLTLEFCANECQGSTLVLCAPAGKGGRSGGRKEVVRPSGRGRMPNSMSNGHLQAHQQQQHVVLAAEEEQQRMAKAFSANSTLPVGGGGKGSQGVGGDTMYTNAANLEQTISLQQELFRQSMCIQQQQRGRTPRNKTETEQRVRRRAEESTGQQREKVSAEQEGEGEEQRMEWKVKRRPDGSRYIVRRPVQSRVLRSRELQKAVVPQNEGMTTEDDTMSEIKLGRYWSKDERKKHMERARERRSRQEQVLEGVRKNQQNGGGAGEEVKGLVISHQQSKGLMKGNGGEATGAGGGECKDNKMGGLLSVTTV